MHNDANFFPLHPKPNVSTVGQPALLQLSRISYRAQQNIVDSNSILGYDWYRGVERHNELKGTAKKRKRVTLKCRSVISLLSVLRIKGGDTGHDNILKLNSSEDTAGNCATLLNSYKLCMLNTIKKTAWIFIMRFFQEK